MDVACRQYGHGTKIHLPRVSTISISSRFSLATSFRKLLARQCRSLVGYDAFASIGYQRLFSKREGGGGHFYVFLFQMKAYRGGKKPRGSMIDLRKIGKLPIITVDGRGNLSLLSLLDLKNLYADICRFSLVIFQYYKTQFNNLLNVN